MNRSSLDRSLFGATGAPVLEWGERMEVALGAARGLAYLHTGCDQKIVHCDVKPENILLADGGQVKVSDFGLAKLMSPEHSAIFTTMRGTRGYLAPEWLSNAPISDRADVYSFGMVLLELVHGRKNRGEQEQANNTGAAVAGSGDHSAFPSPSGHSSTMTSSTMSGGTSGGDDDYFPMVALELHEQGRHLDLVDRRLEGRVSGAEVERAVRLALCCLHEDPAQRPSMAAVVRVLEGGVPPEPRATRSASCGSTGGATACRPRSMAWMPRRCQLETRQAMDGRRLPPARSWTAHYRTRRRQGSAGRRAHDTTRFSFFDVASTPSCVMAPTYITGMYVFLGSRPQYDNQT
ncbi:hypothetical protein ZWY2020_041337 [Hordeum vulgare]|nr:hypothetical protein ZWY2020_041337 [Hordeum vulgare]